MKNRDKTCTACFPIGSKPMCRIFDNSSSALIIYSGLHAAAKSPAMCQQDDQQYRVCHLQEMQRSIADPWSPPGLCAA